jgi:hypothetical protein
VFDTLTPGMLVYQDDYAGTMYVPCENLYELGNPATVQPGEFMIVLSFHEGLKMYAVVTAGLRIGYAPKFWFLKVVQ